MKTKRTTKTAGPIWVGFHVEPCAERVLDSELIWVGTAISADSQERAERVCKARKVYQVVFERNNVRVQVDFTEGETFADWIACRRDELAIDDPAFDSEAERAIAHDAIRELYRVTNA